MDPSSIDQIYWDASQLASPAERAAYLDGACAHDPKLRGKLEQLLQAQSRSANFLEEPAVRRLGAGEEGPRHEGPGTFIGPYKLLEQIGEGGFGVVFMAEQTRPVRRRVALKIVKPGMDTRQVVARFEAERQALALMEHPNIAHVLDGGETPSGRPYFVMELVRGIPITEFCDRNKLPIRARLELFISVCQAVQHAHQKGIIHRDIKPTNVMVTLHDGTPVVKVIDFGIAKATGQQLTDKTLFTSFAQMIGTPLYTSPEQAQMSGLDVDTRTDIYSLGVMLYELLTGTTPCDRDLLRTAAYDEIRRIIREEEPPRPSARMTTLGKAAATISAQRTSEARLLSKVFRAELDWIVMKALEKDRNRRYETASAFAADVQRYLRDEPVLACRPSATYRLRKLLRRHKGPVLAVALVALALVGGIIGTTWGMIHATYAHADAVQSAQQKEEALKEKESALALAQQSERDAREKLFQALWNQARAGRFSRQMGQRLDSLDALAKAAQIHADHRLRDEATAAMALVDLKRGPRWEANPPGTLLIAFDGLYQSYARVDDKGDISVRGIPDNDVLYRIQAGPIGPLRAMGMSPNGKFVALATDDRGLRVWCVADEQPVLRDTPKNVFCLAFSPDSKQLAVGKEDWVLCFDLASGAETSRLRLPFKVFTLVFHPDSRKLAVGYRNSVTASIVDATQGTLVANLFVGAMQEPVAVAWHPDGNRLAIAGSPSSKIQIWDVASKRRLATLEGHVQEVTMLSFRPDDDLLVSGSWDGVLRLWNPSTGRQLMQLPLSTIPNFSSDGRWLGLAWVGEGQFELLEVAPSPEYRTLVSSEGADRGAYYYGDISPDGRLLALGMAQGTRLWDLRSGRELATVPGFAEFAFFDRSGQAWGLLTCGEKGLNRWPIDGADPTGRLRFGPPVHLSSRMNAGFTRAADGHTLVGLSGGNDPMEVLDLQTGGAGRKLGPHPAAQKMALSRNGQWVATCGWHSDRVRLWNVQTGIMVHEWVLGKQTDVFFSPDSRALIIARGDSLSFWDVESLQLIRRIPCDVALYPSYVAFSPDGKLMAVEMAPAVIHLKEVATGHTVARLEDPHGDRANWMSFTPDGTQLVVEARYARAVHIWDLRAIRTRLKSMALDWEWPEFLPAPTPQSAALLSRAPVKSSNVGVP